MAILASNSRFVESTQNVPEYIEGISISTVNTTGTAGIGVLGD